MADLKTDYKDDVLDVLVNEKRKWIITENGDGTVTIEDATTYSQTGDIFGSADLNAITLAVNECFQSVSNGKTLLASAITDKRVATDATATFSQMAENISKIVLGSGNATKTDVLSGKTFTNDDGIEYVGSMTNNEGTLKSATGSLDSTNKRVQLAVPANAYYSTASKLYIAYATLASLIGLTAAKIVKGNTILGITGTAVKALSSLSGTNTQTIPNDSTQSRTITFSTPFGSIPKVNVSVTRNDDGAQTSSGLEVVVNTITAGGFTCTITNNKGSYQSVTLNWNATA